MAYRTYSQKNRIPTSRAKGRYATGRVRSTSPAPLTQPGANVREQGTKRPADTVGPKPIGGRVRSRGMKR